MHPIQADDAEKDIYQEYVYDDLDVVSSDLLSGGSFVADNFFVSDDGGIARSGNAEASDAEEDELENEPVVLGTEPAQEGHGAALSGLGWGRSIELFFIIAIFAIFHFSRTFFRLFFRRV
jgi:hypothetical protein